MELQDDEQFFENQSRATTKFQTPTILKFEDSERPEHFASIKSLLKNKGPIA